MTVTVSRARVDCAEIKPRRSLRGRIADMVGVHRQRKTLENLDDHMLHDIGISRQDAKIEAKKPVWDVPRHWSK